LEDLEKLSLPDPRRDGRMPYVVEVNKLVREKLGEYRWYNFPVCSPTTLAIQLRGYFNFIKDMRENPGFVHKMLDFCEEVIEHYVRFLQEEISPDPPSMASSWEVVPNFSPRMFREFIYPHTSSVIKRLGGGAWVGGGFPISPMANWESFIRESIARTHTSLFTIIMLDSDWYDLKTLKRISNDTRTPFILGVRAGLISGGTKEDISAFVKKAIVEMGPGGGCFVFGDQIPQHTDPGNVQCLVDSVKRLGRFPICT
jgi:uroporphyrinogen decarboxylase